MCMKFECDKCDYLNEIQYDQIRLHTISIKSNNSRYIINIAHLQRE